MNCIYCERRCTSKHRCKVLAKSKAEHDKRAEAAVLRAIGSVSEGWLRHSLASATEAAVVLTCQAELTRRGLKP